MCWGSGIGLQPRGAGRHRQDADATGAGSQIFLRNEFQRDGVDAVAEAGGRGAVGEDVAEVGVAAGAEGFFADHAVAGIFFGDDVFRGDGLEKAGPAGAGVKFGVGAEEREVAADAVVDPGLLAVVEGAAERALGAFAAGDGVDFAVAELFAPLGVGFDDFFHSLGGESFAVLVQQDNAHGRSGGFRGEDRGGKQESEQQLGHRGNFRRAGGVVKADVRRGDRPERGKDEKKSRLFGGVAFAASGGFGQKIFLRVAGGLGDGGSEVGAVGLEDTGFDVVSAEGVDDLLNVLFDGGAFDGEDGFDAVKGIAFHPVGAADEVARVAGVFEAVEAAVLEEASDDAAHFDVFAHAGQSGAEGADAADKEFDFHAGAGCAVEGLDDFLLHEGIEFGEDAGRFAGTGVFDLAVDEGKNFAVQMPRGDEKFFRRREAGDAGDGVEEVGHILGDVGAGGEEAEVGVEAGGGRMVVAGAEVDVAADAVVFLAHDHGHLGVGLESGHTIDDIDAGFAELAGPFDVGGFVEAGFQLDGDDDLFAGARGLDEERDEWGVGAGAVKRLLDGEHLRVLGGLADEVEDGLKAVIRMMQQDVAFADVEKDVVFLSEADDGDGGEAFVFEVRAVEFGGDGHEPHEVERPIDAVDVLFFEVEDFAEAADEFFGDVLHFEADGVAAVELAEFVFDGAQEVAGFFLVDVEVAVARDAEHVGAMDFDAVEEAADMGLHEVAEEDEVLAVAVFFGEGQEAREDARDLHDGEIGGEVFALQFDEEVEAFVEELREGVRGVDGQRGEDGEDFAFEVVVEVGARGRFDVGVTVEADAFGGEAGADFLTPASVLVCDETADAMGDGGELLCGGKAVGSGGLRAGLHDLFEPGHADLEEFVEVGRDDAEEFEALEERGGGIFGLIEDALVEFQPTQLAIDKILGIGKIHRQPSSVRRVTRKLKRKARRPLAPRGICGRVGGMKRVAFIFLTVMCWSASAPASSSAARALGDAFAGVYERVAPSVVVLEVTKPNGGDDDVSWESLFGGAPGSERPRGNESEGSGFIIGADGYILTNAHVIEGADPEKGVVARRQDGTKLPLKVVGVDEKTDLAVLKAEAGGLPAVTWGDSEKARVGEFVCGIGAPFELDYTLTVGVISAKGRSNLTSTVYEDYLQTDAAINPGNSGGPLVDLDGKVIGVNTLINGLSRGLGFAIPANLARQVSEALIAQGRVVRPWLGIRIETLGDEPSLQEMLGVDQGVVVREIFADTPASRSDLAPADVVVDVDGQAVESARELQQTILGKSIGQEVKLKVWRRKDSSFRTVSVKAEELPPVPTMASAGRRTAPFRPPESGVEGAEAPLGPLGLQVQNLPEDLAEEMSLPAGGVIVTHVEPGSPADMAGLQRRDVVTAVGDETVKDEEAFGAALQKISGEEGAVLLVERKGKKTYAILRP